MKAIEILREEYLNVKNALEETLRYDYGPQQSDDFYIECAGRLNRIERRIAPGAISETDKNSIAGHLNELGYLGTLICLIERSRLGEFSWPFAVDLRKLASELLVDISMLDNVQPIVQVVADGRGYRIHAEDSVHAPSGNRRFSIILFPRPAKHHVLLHTIFGHELGHAALKTIIAGTALRATVLDSLNKGVFANEATVNNWLASEGAPAELKVELAAYEKQYGRPFALIEEFRTNWLTEFVCDLYGLLLFGPAFLAAHRTLIEPLSPHPLRFDLTEPTHPPYGVRHRILVAAMRILQWHKTITLNDDGALHNAELEFINSAIAQHENTWAPPFSETELTNAIAGMKAIIADHIYQPPNRRSFVGLLNRLKRSLPPLLDGLSDAGDPQLERTDFRQILHAGWAFWGGKHCVPDATNIPFLIVNRLCNQALLQQQAINEFVV